ncbi:MAG: tetratricopeptide repeat protein [Cyclobacteriaceae bacterium]
MKGKDLLTKILVFLYLAVLITMAYYYWQGADSSIDWKITTHAEPSEFIAYQFQKGPFELSVPGNFYSLTESFSAGPIERYLNRDSIFLVLTWAGILMILTLATYLSRIWFTGVAGLFIFMIINMKFSAIQLFGFGDFSSWGNLVLISLFIAPAYVFQAYFKYANFVLRLSTFVIASIVVVLFGSVEVVALQEQFNIGIYFSMMVLMLLFLTIVAEENVFAILFLITKNRGGEHNEKHFSVFSLVYLGFLGMVYGKKAGFLKMELPFFDPYILLIISSLIALSSLKHKQHIYNNLLSQDQALQIFAAIGLAIFSYLGLAFSRGNDPVFEGLHYFIVYAHLGFGVLFFIYTIVNFVNPLASGFQVYKVVYKERNFPYVTARIAGVIIVLAFFLYADKEPFKLFRAGHFNYLGEQAELNNEDGLAHQYYIEGSIYGHDNHFSNYKVAYRNLQKGKTEEANYKFGRATLRYPTPQAFVNQSSTYGMLNEVTPSSIALQTGLKRFPGNNSILNNLGLIYTDLGNLETAKSYFSQASEKESWNSANQVNLWRIGMGENPAQSFSEGSLGVKSNVVANALALNTEFDIDFNPEDLNSSYSLHRNTYLINSAWYFNSDESRNALNFNTQNPLEEGVYENSLHALAWSTYKSGNVNQALKKLDQLSHQSNSSNRGKYWNEMGLIALDQHSPGVALSFFERALESGNGEAFLNKAVALLEKGDFESAIDFMQVMASADSSQQAMLDDFQIILNEDHLTEDQELIKRYYQYNTYSIAEMSEWVPSQNPIYLKSLWKKLSKETLERQDVEALESYMKVFDPFLDTQDYESCLTILALESGVDLPQGHPVTAILSSEDSIKSQLLFEKGEQNALDAPLVLAIAKHLEKENLQMSYDLLVESIDINPNHIGLLKAYAMTALEINLVDYARPVIDRLSSLLSKSEFEAFYFAFETKKKELEEREVEW